MKTIRHKPEPMKRDFIRAHPFSKGPQGPKSEVKSKSPSLQFTKQDSDFAPKKHFPLSAYKPSPFRPFSFLFSPQIPPPDNWSRLVSKISISREQRETKMLVKRQHSQLFSPKDNEKFEETHFPTFLENVPERKFFLNKCDLKRKKKERNRKKKIKEQNRINKVINIDSSLRKNYNNFEIKGKDTFQSFSNQKNIYLKNLYQFLLSFLKGEKHGLFKLNDFNKNENKILKLINKKKKYIGFKSFKKIIIKDFVNCSNNIFNLLSDKRKEEKKKYVFRILYKIVFENFLKNHPKPLQNNSKSEEFYFYQFYYGKFAPNTKKLEDFWEYKFPDFKINGNDSKCKTINKNCLLNLNLSIPLVKFLNKILIEVIFWKLPLYESEDKIVEEECKSTKMILDDLFERNKQDLLNKIKEWNSMISISKTEEELYKKIELDIEKVTFKFPWTIWEIKNAFLSTFLALNEYTIQRCTHPLNQNLLSQDEKLFVSKKASFVGKESKSQSNKKSKFIKEELLKFKQSKDRFYWIGLLNKYSISKIFGAYFSNRVSEARSLSQVEFESEMHRARDFSQLSDRIKLHLFSIFYNMYSDIVFRSKIKAKGKFLRCQRFVNCVNGLLGSLSPNLGANPLATYQSFFEKIYHSVFNEDSVYDLKIAQSLKFISNFQCILIGKKNRVILRESCNFISRFSYRKKDIRNLKPILSKMVNLT